MKQNYFTAAEVAERLERRLETVSEYMVLGQLATVRLANGEMCVPMDALWPRRRVSESDE